MCLVINRWNVMEWKDGMDGMDGMDVMDDRSCVLTTIHCKQRTLKSKKAAH